VNGDYQRLKQWEKRSYQAYQILEVLNDDGSIREWDYFSQWVEGDGNKVGLL
jgi:hypothetical protein